MSSEEEKKAIEFFEKRKNICLENANICDENDYDGEAEYLREEKMYIDTVLNIITKQQKENEELRKGQNSLMQSRKKWKDRYYKLKAKSKKIIDLMAEYISNIQDCPLENCGVDLDCENRCDNDEEVIKQCWKIYFESKSKEE